MKYVTRAYFTQYVEWAERYAMTDDQVIEADPSPQETGLLDVHGDKIFRVQERLPFGFQVKS